MVDSGFEPGRPGPILDAAEEIAKTTVAEHAVEWDRECRFPAELFERLHEHRLDALAVPRRLGGHEVGPDTADPLTLWLVLRTLATEDSASTHCLQLQSNTAHAIRLLGTPEQQDRFLGPVTGEGAVLSFWGSEASGRPKSAAMPFTTARRVPGGWAVSGHKYYATNARAARFAAIFAVPEGASDPVAEMMVMIVDCTDDGVVVDTGWWSRSTAMRATVSDHVVLDDVFVPDVAVLGGAGTYWALQAQARYLPAFSANFQGVGAHLLDYAVEYLSGRGRGDDATVCRYIGEARTRLTTADLLLRRTAEVFATGPSAEAFLHARMVRAYSEAAVRRVIELFEATCGSSIYFADHPTERILRDWNMFSRHENIDLILEAVGSATFGRDSGQDPEDFGFAGYRVPGA